MKSLTFCCLLALVGFLGTHPAQALPEYCHQICSDEACGKTCWDTSRAVATTCAQYNGYCENPGTCQYSSSFYAQNCFVTSGDYQDTGTDFSYDQPWCYEDNWERTCHDEDCFYMYFVEYRDCSSGYEARNQQHITVCGEKTYTSTNSYLCG